MFTKAGLLIAVVLVLFGYRWGRRKALARTAPPSAQVSQAAQTPQPDAPRKEWISVKALLVIVAILLLIAILSSLGGKIG